MKINPKMSKIVQKKEKSLFNKISSKMQNG